MKKVLLAALVASTGCAGNVAPEASVESTSQAVVTVSAATTGGAPSTKKSHGLPPVRPGVYPAGRGAPGHGGGQGSGKWTTVANTPVTAAPGFSILLTDGSVMVQDLNTYGNGWWKLTPDTTGSYVNGTWTTLAPMPNGYAPLYFAAGVLPDGRVIVMGGEYQAFNPTWTTQGAIYDPVLDQWTSVAPPAGWQTIGDAQSAVLADGRFVLANCCTTDMAVLNPTTLTWSPIGSGKADIFDEEGWTLLWNGDVLTVDANNTANLTNSEIFFPGTARKPAVWTSAGSTGVQLADLGADGSGSHELGPAMLRPDGTVFASGAIGHTAIYDSLRGTWKAGPDFPVLAGEGQMDQADGPAALLPDGNVLVAASWGVFNGPVHFFEFDGTSLTQVAEPADSVYDSSYNINLLLLPSGEVLETDFSGDVEIYTPTGHARGCWAPSPDSCGLSSLHRGKSYSISGEQLHGLSQGTSYGDDAQAATNYPIARITNRATGHVGFGRTHSFNSFSIAPGAWSKATLDIPSTVELGDSDLVIIANGIASSPIRTTIGQ
ncbi:MAG: hypothetical protein ACHREM_15700 [Polyangiales bacterium]